MKRPNSKACRKRWKRKKSHSYTVPVSKTTTALPESNQDEYQEECAALSTCQDEQEHQYFGDERSDFSINMHDYALLTSESTATVAPRTPSENAVKTPHPIEVPTELLVDVRNKMELFLNHRWVPIVHRNSVHAVLMSAQNNVTVQRSIVFEPDGGVQVYVHCKNIEETQFLTGVSVPVPLEKETVGYFVDRAIEIVNKVKCMEICSGYDDDKYKDVWSICPFGQVDSNPYQECRYVETFRSFSCLRLVSGRKWRCQECTKLYGPLMRRAKSAANLNPHASTRNEFLTEKQKLKKLEDQRKQIQSSNEKLARLQKRMQNIISKEGVQVDNELSESLTEILNDSKVSPAQSIFLQQQVKSSQLKNMAGMRWHPTMIRFALSIHITSPSVYNMLRDTGMVKLPSSRTLFDYARVKPVEEGIDSTVLESIGKRIQNFKIKERYKRYHVLMADEMYISQNLVFQKSSGRLIGYTSLDYIDQEVNELEQYLKNHEEEAPPTVATKVMVFMIKGVSSGIKEVVATYGVGNLSANQMYVWTWQVIGALERTGIAVIAFVSDGCSVNRAFIKMHEPVTTIPSGIIFDTRNKAAPHRTLYFISDVPHLLKTIRNNLLNSRSDKRKSRRHMMFRGKKISWDYIIKLFSLKKHKVFKKSFKLTSMNVYPDSYARMKVKYAAEVLSRTVAQDLSDQGWPQASETIKFIRLVNDWFDCMNGAHSSVGKRKKNSNLDAYEKEEDPRFETMREFLEYLDEWKKEANNPSSTLNITASMDVSLNATMCAMDDSLNPEEDDGSVVSDETPASKRIMSAQTLEGIERTTRALMAMIPFLLSEGTKFINARVFTQDPLEQHFSKLRAGQGGSTNPNLGQVLNRNRSLHLIGQLGIKRRKGNSQEGMESVVVTSEPLPKRKCERLLKFRDLS